MIEKISEWHSNSVKSEMQVICIGLLYKIRDNNIFL